MPGNGDATQEEGMNKTPSRNKCKQVSDRGQYAKGGCGAFRREMLVRRDVKS